MAARYRLRTFGGVSLEGPAGPMSGAATQHRRLALLVLVAAAGERGVSRDRLIGLLWPDSEPAKARQVLAQWLHLIRRDLGEDALFLGTQELRLNPERITSDVGELGAALDRADIERAAALYAGPFLDGFYLSGAPEFERWVEEERPRLSARMRSAYQATAREAAERGDWAGAARWGERLASLDPLDAGIALAYMRALEKSGERAKAIQHARVHAAMVRQELDAEPDPAVAALAEQLRAAPECEVPKRETPAAREEPTPPGSTSQAADRVPAAHAAAPAPPAAPAASPRVRAGRFIRLGYVAGIASVALFALFAAPSARPKPAASRVMIAAFANETGDSTLDALGRMASDWITRGVGETGVMQIAAASAQANRGDSTPTTVAAAAGAGTLITGRFYRQGDSLAFTAMISDVTGDRVLRTIGPVLASPTRPLDGVEQLRRRVMGSVAALVDSGFAALAEVVAEPPSYEAYRAMVEGNQAASLRRHREALAHYRRAAVLDSTYLYAVVRVAATYNNMNDCWRVDSVGRELAARRERLSAYERYSIDRELQICAGDLHAAYRTARRLRQLAPRSRGTTMLLARAALVINRPREVVDLLLDEGTRPAELSMQIGAYNLLTLALHSLGDHPRELELARRARAQYVDQVEPLEYEVRALIALGRLEETEQVIEASLAMGLQRAPSSAMGRLTTDVLVTAMDELRAHGHTDRSRAVGVQLAEWLARRPPPIADVDQDREYLFALCTALIGAGRLEEARRAVDTLTRRHPVGYGTLAARGRLAAVLGDVREAERISDSLAVLGWPYLRGEPTHVRAQIAALLGQRDRAVQLLRDAIAEGLPFDGHRAPHVRGVNHAIPEFHSLRGYPPFEELLRPRG